MNGNLFEKRVFADGIKLRIWRRARSVLSGCTLNAVTGVLTREKRDKAQRHTEEKTRIETEETCKDGVRGWSDTATSQGTPDFPEAGQGEEDFLQSFWMSVALPAP